MRPEWEYVRQGFDAPARGWDVPAVAAVYRRRWSEFVAAVEGTGTLGIAHEVPSGQAVVVDDPGWHNVIVTFGYVLARATRDRRTATLLDWGGGPGHYCVLARALLPEVELEYHSRDLPLLTALGREVLPEARFHDDDSCFERTYDLVLASDSLQYVRDWQSVLAALAGCAAPWLYVALVPTAEHAEPFVVVQRPDAYGYETEYLGWVFNRAELLAVAAQSGLVLEREFIAPGVIDALSAPEHARLRSFLFRRS
jgi:putative methyltransferase (TIGR04325 family)